MCLINSQCNIFSVLDKHSQSVLRSTFEFFDDQFFVSVNFALCPDMKLDSAFFELNLI
jgi:hypothetical protein